MQIVSNGDNLYEMSNHVSWEEHFKVSSAKCSTQSAERLLNKTIRVFNYLLQTRAISQIQIIKMSLLFTQKAPMESFYTVSWLIVRGPMSLFRKK